VGVGVGVEVRVRMGVGVGAEVRVGMGVGVGVGAGAGVCMHGEGSRREEGSVTDFGEAWSDLTGVGYPPSSYTAACIRPL
jgi:hypothetical protein